LAGAPNDTGETGDISWWFFDTTGAIQYEGSMSTGCDDFVPFDWGTEAGSSGINAFQLFATNLLHGAG
jgi:hypothetical protein